ncbi:hypothetical protein ODZ43_28110, partial [Escherichia coli]|nr:hypothetical protein [Escherichia coli]
LCRYQRKQVHFNIKNNSIYISESIEEGLFLFFFFFFLNKLGGLRYINATSNGDMKKCIAKKLTRFYITPLDSRNYTNPTKCPPAHNLSDSKTVTVSIQNSHN